MAILIATFTYSHYLMSLEAAKLRNELWADGNTHITTLQFHLGGIIELQRIAFSLSMISTNSVSLCSVAVLVHILLRPGGPWSAQKRLLYQTRVHVDCVGIVLFDVVGEGSCVQLHLLASHCPVYTNINYKCVCTLACGVALTVFLVCSFVFVAINNLCYYW